MSTDITYTVYKTTNLINGKYYIGVHKTNNPNDEYLGSGIALNNSIKIHGRDNFVKEILYEYDNKQDAYNKEKELVNENTINDIQCYNMKIGGVGGFDHIDTKGENNPMFNCKRSEEWKSSHSKFMKENNPMKGKSGYWKGKKGPKKNKKTCEKISKALKNKPKSEETKRKLSIANSIKVTCPHCNKVGGKTAMYRYHFDKCKNRK